ncbi:fimbrial protein [Enterobacteriaceae bacterium LUAb1]
MKIKKFLLFFFTVIISQKINATCSIETGLININDTPTGKPIVAVGPQTLSIPGQLISINANAPIGYITTLETSMMNQYMTYNCHDNILQGASVRPVFRAASRYPTNIDGIEFEAFYKTRSIPFSVPQNKPGITRLWILPDVKFGLKFYKTKPRLNLTNSQGDELLPPNDHFLDLWINSDLADNYTAKLNIGQLMLISTPVCEFNNSKTVNFNTVTSTNIARGVRRPLDFGLKCDTDYGNYSVTASLKAENHTDDNKYIKVTDKNGNTDRMKIRIDDSNNEQMMVDGSTTDIKKNISSSSTTQFNWTTTLLRGSSIELPAGGQFTASAEILLKVE